MSEVGPGQRAPSFRLPSLGGVAVAVPGGSPLTLLVFYKASCPTCEWALPFVQALHERADGLAVVGVASDAEDEARAFAEKLGLTFPVGVESEPWDVSAAYALTTVPTLFLVGESGKVLLTSPGFSRDDFLEVARRAAERSGGAPADPFPEGAEIPAFRPG